MQTESTSIENYPIKGLIPIDLQNAHIRSGYFKKSDRTISRATPWKNKTQKGIFYLKFLEDSKLKDNMTHEGSEKKLTLAMEERSSAIVDELKRNANEKAFLGYPFGF